MPVDTSKSSDRRAARYDTLEALRRDVDALEAAFLRGSLRTSGNWNAAQNFNHLAAFVEYGYDGYPAELRSPPWFVKVFGRMMKERLLSKGFPAGVRIPRIPGGTLGWEDGSTPDAIARLRRAIDRMEREAPTQRSPVMGELSHQDSERMMLRHCELHLSFLHPE